MLSKNVSPLFTATMMSFVSTILFFPLALAEGVAFVFSAISLADWLGIVYYGVVVTAVAFILWFRGVSRVPASTAAVFTGVMPISAVVFSYLILREPFQWSHLWGGLCVLIGLVFIMRETSNRQNKTLNHKGDKSHVYPIQQLEDGIS